MKIVILCGGTGTRLWPMSRQSKPKQFFDIISENPMIVDTYNRVADDFATDDIYFSTNENFVPALKNHFPELKDENIIVDPVPGRDTGPAQGYACIYMQLICPDEPIVFVPSDHYIANVKKFLRSVRVGEQVINDTGKMLDIGIQPNFPSTALGYTHVGNIHQEIDNIDVFEFLGHKEKPPYEQAKQYVESGEYLWHANFYMWTPNLFLRAFENYAPEMYEKLAQIREYLKDDNHVKIKETYGQLEKISIDYAVTEKMDPADVLIINGTFGWSDIGAWDVLYDKMNLDFDDCSNLVKANCVPVDTRKSLIYGPKDKLIATIGLDGMVVVDTGDVLLVCPQGRAQDVKKIVASIKEKGHHHYL